MSDFDWYHMTTLINIYRNIKLSIYIIYIKSKYNGIEQKIEKLPSA